MDAVGIYNNITFRCLTENMRQPHNIKAVRINHIPQHISRSNTRKLVYIAHQNQAGSHSNRLQQIMEQENIYHRHLINYYDVGFKRIPLISAK